MTEPPIIRPKTAGQFPTNQFSDPPSSGQIGGPTLPSQFPPPSGAGGQRLLVLLLAACGCLFLFCAGFVAWLAYSFQSKSPITAEFRERHSPVNSLPGESLREPLRQPTAIVDEKTEGVAEFVAELAYAVADDDVVDFPRFIQEVQDSGEAIGINGVTRLLWIEAAKISTELPQFSEDNVVVGMQWLVPEREVRATIVSYWAAYDQPEVWYLYLKKHEDAWKLYDWREALEPMSEAQFFAVYNATSARKQEDFTEFAYKVDELYYDDEVPLKDKATETINAFRLRQYPQSLLPYAQYHCAQYLVLYEDGQKLNSLAQEMDPSASFGASYYQGYAAYLLDDHATAFRHAERIMDELGWYPAAAILASYAAETEEQKRKAAGWLATSVVLMPDFSLPVEQLFEVADDAILEEALAGFSQSPSKLARFVALVDSLAWDESDNLDRLVAAARTVPELADELPYGQFVLAKQSNAHDEALKHGAKLLADARYEDYREEIQASFAEIAVRGGRLGSASAVAPDRVGLVRAVRELTLSHWETGLDWKEILELFGTDMGPEWPEELGTKVAKSRCLLELGREGEALDIALPCLVTDGSLLLSGEDESGLGYLFFDVAAEAALKCERDQELVDAIDEPETAFVVLAQKALELERLPELNHLLEWYVTTDAPAVWKHYYQAQLAYSNGEADMALQEIALANQEAMGDGRFAEGDFPTIVGEYAPDLDAILSERIEIALRCGKLAELVNELIERDDELESGWHYELGWQITNFEAPDLLPDLIVALKDSGIPEVELLRHDLISDQYIVNGNIESAFNEVLVAAKLSADENGFEYYENPYLQDAIEMVLKFPILQQRFNDLYGVPAADSQKISLRAASALLANDAAEFIAALDEYDSEYERESWYWDTFRIQAQQQVGVWQESNRVNPIELQNIYHDTSAHGAVLLERPASEVEVELVKAFSDALMQPLEAVGQAVFPETVGVYSAKVQDGVLLLALFDGLPSAVSKGSAFARQSESYAGCCALTFVPNLPVVLPEKQLRNWVAKAGLQLDYASAYNDERTDCWYVEAGWAARLQGTTGSGFDPLHPRAKSAWWESKKESELVVAEGGTQDDAAIHYSAGLITERIPVVVESQRGGIATVRLKSDALSAPYLVRDSRLEVPSP